MFTHRIIRPVIGARLSVSQFIQVKFDNLVQVLFQTKNFIIKRHSEVHGPQLSTVFEWQKDIADAPNWSVVITVDHHLDHLKVGENGGKHVKSGRQI